MTVWKKNNLRHLVRTYSCGIQLLVLLYALLAVQNAHALGIGSAVAESYIGERLSAVIPIFNVTQPNALEIKLVSSSIDRSTGIGLNVSLDRSNSQLALRIRTEQPVNEPYLMFTLAVTDAGNTLNKEFTLLLNLSPEITSEPASSAYVPTRSPRAEPLTGNASGNNLGPYEWAQAGNIPATFGAVIDGQSLWRVARRINRAMGVSINQMMWALYQNNRQAFLSDSVDSLRAGTYLNIPGIDQVRRLSDSQAKQALSELSRGVSTGQSREAQPVEDAGEAPAQPAGDAPPGAVEVIEPDSTQADDGVGTVADSESFRLTGIDEQPGGGSAGNEIDSEKSQEIIASLAATVGNLTQELIQKDKKIDFLENKIVTLEKLLGAEASTFADSALAENPAPVAEQASEVETVVAPAEPSSDSRWSWLAGLFAVLLALAFFFREKLMDLAQDLNLFGGEREVHFEPSLAETPQSSGASPAKSDQEIFAAVKEAMNTKQEQGVAFIDELDDVDKAPDTSDMPEGIELDESNLDFEQRFERLLNERDYGFALELLDFARHNEIEEDQYHCERLRLFEAKGDEDGFYEYYYDIEASIPSFNLDVQNRISQLVVKLAQTKV